MEYFVIQAPVITKKLQDLLKIKKESRLNISTATEIFWGFSQNETCNVVATSNLTLLVQLSTEYDPS
jgi:hypothetical protein